MRLDTPARQSLFATVRLEVETATERSVATAFVYQMHDGRHHWNFLVTCRHVVEDGLRAHLFFTRADLTHAVPTIGVRRQIQVDDFARKWFFHPDPGIDIAVAPIASLIPATSEGFVYLTAINEDALPTSRTWAELEVIEDVLFIGYPDGYYDHTNLLPIARRGITASPPHFDYDGRPEFLVDAAVHFGSSGSPVVIIRELPMWHRLLRRRYYFVFLGVITNVLKSRFDASLKPRPVTHGRSVDSQLLNLGVVLKSQLVHETAIKYIAQASGIPAAEGTSRTSA